MPSRAPQSPVMRATLATVIGVLLSCPALADTPVQARISYQRASDFFVTGAAMAEDTDGDSNVDRIVDPAYAVVSTADIPGGVVLQQALLYWGGSIPDGGNDCGPNAPIDEEVAVRPPGQGVSSVLADVCYCSAAGAGSYDVQACRADVTSLANGQMVGTWSVGGFAALIDDGSTNNASFALILIYGGPGLPARQITIYDGLATMSQSSLTLTLGGIEIDDPPSGDLTWYTLEGDPGGSAGEQVVVTGAPGGQPLVLSDAVNPAGNPMNRTINTTNPPQTGVSGVDIDGFDISPALAAGDSELVVDYTAGTDKWWIVFDIVGVNVFFPSFSEASGKTWAMTLDADGSGGPSPGDHVRYAISMVNGGSGNAVLDVVDVISTAFSSWEVVSTGGGVDESTADTLRVSGIPVPTGGVAQIMFDAVIGEVPNATIIDNVASWHVPENDTVGQLFAPSMQVFWPDGDDDDDDDDDDDSVGDDDTSDADDDDSAVGDDDGSGRPPGWTPNRAGACACATASTGPLGGGLALLLLGLVVRRRRW